MKILKDIYTKNKLFFKFKNRKRLILQIWNVFISFNQLINYFIIIENLYKYAKLQIYWQSYWEKKNLNMYPKTPNEKEKMTQIA